MSGYTGGMVATRYPIDFSLQAPLTVEKYHRVIDAGILGKEDHVELLEGVLVEMSPRATDTQSLSRGSTRRWRV